MKTYLPNAFLAVLLLALFAPDTQATNTRPTNDDIVVHAKRVGQLETLARVSGLSVNDLKMVLGIRRPGYTEYVMSYAWSHRRLRTALGADRYATLFAARDGSALDARLTEVTDDLPTR